MCSTTSVVLCEGAWLAKIPVILQNTVEKSRKNLFLVVE